jgi:hypothetical protein
MPLNGTTILQLPITSVTSPADQIWMELARFDGSSWVSNRITLSSIQSSLVSGYVPSTREVQTGPGLTGGGTLEANLTLSLDVESLPDKSQMVVADSFAINDSTNGTSKKTTFEGAMQAIPGLTSLSGQPDPTQDFLIIHHAADDTIYKVNPSDLSLVTGNMPAGGTTGQQLVKASDADYDTTWSTGGFLDQPAGYFFGGPTSGAAAQPAFRALVSTDIPAALTLGVSGTTIGTLSLAGNTSGTAVITPQAAAGTPTITLPTASGTVAVSASAPLVLNATTGALSVTSAALTKSDDTNVTLTLGGSPSTALLAATSLGLSWNGQLSLTRGGTNANLTASNGGIVYSDASAMAILSGTATAGQIVRSGASAAPSWSTATYPDTAAQGSILNAGSANVLSATVTPVLGVAGSSLGTLGLSGNTSGVVTVRPAAAAGTWTLTLPTSGGTNNYVLTTDGSGTTTWTDITSGIAANRALSNLASVAINTTLLPGSNDGAALGSGTLSFSDLFLASGGLINFANSNVVLTHSTGVLTVSTGDLRITTAGTNSASAVTVGGTQTLTAKTLTSPTITTSPTAAGATWTSLGTVTTIDINGGTIDGTIIGGASAAAGTFTTAVANSFVPNAATIPSNGMYLPAANTLGWGIDSTAELQLTSTALSPATGGGLSLGTTSLGWQDLFAASGFTFNVDNGNWVSTHSSGVMTVSTGDLRVTTAGTNSASVVTVGGTQTLTNKTLTSPTIGGSPNASGATWSNLGIVTTTDINGGTVDGTTIGATTPAAGTFSDLTANSTLVASAATTTLGVTNGAIDMGGATSLEIPNSASPVVNADGEIAIDTTVADFAQGVVTYYSTAQMGVVAMPIAQFASPQDGATPTYNAASDIFELVVGGGGGGANTALSNLAGTTAINSSLVSDTDITDDLGSLAIRWRTVFTERVGTGDTAADTLKISAYDSDNTVFVDFMTLTAGNTPTATMSGITASSTFTPTSSDGAALGTTALMWSDLFLASGGNINWNNGDVLITHGSNSLSFTGASSGYSFDAAVLPSSNDAAALGTATTSWADLFLASGAVLNFANGNAVVTHSSGILTVSTGDLRVTTAGTNAASVVTTAGTQTLTNKTIGVTQLSGQVSVANGGTGLASGTSGGVPYYSGTTTIASSGALTASTLVRGGGAGNAPTSGSLTDDASGNIAGFVSQNTGAIAGFHNAIINGGMMMARRGTSFTNATFPANNDDTYTLERWILLSDGNDVVNVSQSSSSPTDSLNSLLMTTVTGAKKFGICQIIEQKNCIGLIGNTVTLSFWALVNNATNVSNVKAAILAWTGTADTVTSDVVSAWGADGTTPTFAANWTAENTPADLNVTTSWAKYSVTATVDTASTNNIAVFIWSDDPVAGTGDTLRITDVQLEIGSQATLFERRLIGTEQMLCDRYGFYVRDINAGARLCNGLNASTTVTTMLIPNVALRAPLPTISFNDLTISPGTIAVTNVSSASVAGGTLSFNVTVASGLTANALTQIRINSTSTYLFFDAEL